MRSVLVAAGLAAALAGAALAEPVNVRTAEKMLFSPKGFTIAIRRDVGLSATDSAVLGVLVDIYSGKVPKGLSRDQLAQFKKTEPEYYGAIAYAPGDGLMSNATFMSTRLHTPEAAAEAAIKTCNSLKKSGPSCVVVADVLPKNWQRQAVSLNAPATADLRDYKRGRGPKAMAVSPATGIYSIAKGPNADRAAMNDCLAKAQPRGAQDCAIVIADN